MWADGSRRSAGFGQLRDRQRGVRQLARRIERHAQHAQQLFDKLITGRVIDQFGIPQRHLQRGQHRTGDGGSGQPRLGPEELAASSTSTLSRSNNSPSSSSTSATAASKGSDLVEKWL